MHHYAAIIAAQSVATAFPRSPLFPLLLVRERDRKTSPSNSFILLAIKSLATRDRGVAITRSKNRHRFKWTKNGHNLCATNPERCKIENQAPMKWKIDEFRHSDRSMMIFSID